MRSVVPDFQAIEDYYIIGDLRTAALVSKGGSIDWLCLPYFDSPSVFGKLLDKSAGSFAIYMPGHKIASAYVKDTAIVNFCLTGGETKIYIKDYMVPKKTAETITQHLIRQISVENGSAEIKFKLQHMPGYGLEKAQVECDSSKVKLVLAEGALIIHLPLDTRVQRADNYFLISIPVKVNDDKQLVLEYVPKGKTSNYSTNNLEQTTTEFWKDWVKQGQFFDFCRDNLVRSAITLKLLQFYPTGALVAAPTTSLPEDIGGVRNWDYRYVWIRDATFTLYAFYMLGYFDEAEQFFNFIEIVTEKCVERDFDISLMYTIWGEPVPKEQLVPQLSGYKNSPPVRIGNDAAGQFQLDVYGALIDAIYFASKSQLTNESKAKRRNLVIQLVKKIEELWQKPDSGIWEARSSRKHYTYSKVMAWVGADRAKRLEKHLDLTDEDLDVCEKLADNISQWIWQNCYDDELNIIKQHPGTQAVDATSFLFVLLQFLDKHDDRTRQIIDKTAAELGNKAVFVYRYFTEDGLPGQEGAFLLCSFWLISALAILEDVNEAERLFKELEKYFKPHGLLPEEIDPINGDFLGNYPQAFSHMGFIMSAYYIDKYKRRLTG